MKKGFSCFVSGAEVSDDGRYVLISVRNGCDPVNKLYYVDLDTLGYEIKGILIYSFQSNKECTCGKQTVI